jgi:hypothetical protein
MAFDTNENNKKGRLPQIRQAAREKSDIPVTAVVSQYYSMSYMGMPKQCAAYN